MSEAVELKRTLSLPLLTFYGLGTILGAGIYVRVGEVAGIAGMHTPLAFAVAAMVAAFTAFSYAEMAARHPRSAAEAVYVQEGFGQPWLSMLVGALVLLAALASAAALANGFAGYLRVFIAVPAWATVPAFVLCLGALAAWGCRLRWAACTAPGERPCLPPRGHGGTEDLKILR